MQNDFNEQLKYLDMKRDEFNNKLFAIPNDEIIETAKNQLSQLCENSDKNFTMCVPVRLDDTDIIYAEIIRRLENESTTNKKLIEKSTKVVYKLVDGKVFLQLGNIQIEIADAMANIINDLEQQNKELIECLEFIKNFADRQIINHIDCVLSNDNQKT